MVCVREGGERDLWNSGGGRLESVVCVREGGERGLWDSGGGETGVCGLWSVVCVRDGGGRVSECCDVRGGRRVSFV